jgi:hypothetical protein
MVESSDFNVKTVELTWKKLAEYINNFSDEELKYPEYKRSSKAVTNRWLQLSKYLIDTIADHLIENNLIYFVPGIR